MNTIVTKTIEKTSFTLEAQENEYAWETCVVYDARLFDAEGNMVSYACLMQGSISMPEGTVVSSIETHPDHRRKGYARLLIEQASAQLGAIHTTGYSSASGNAFILGVGIELMPEGQHRIARQGDYSFVNWETGERA